MLIEVFSGVLVLVQDLASMFGNLLGLLSRDDDYPVGITNDNVTGTNENPSDCDWAID